MSSRVHAHNFQWHDRDAYYMCKTRTCRVREAQCVMCGKRLGVVRPERGSSFCSPEHQAKFERVTRDNRGPAGLREMFRF